MYEGAFRAGQRHGEGVLRYATGESVAGNWEEGVLIDPAPEDAPAADMAED